MTALFNRLGDRMLRAVLPQAEAGATQCWPYPQCHQCYGSYCISYTPCGHDGSTTPGPAPWCYIRASGSSGMSYRPCPC